MNARDARMKQRLARAPRAVARRARTSAEKYRHALRRKRSSEEVVTRALGDGQDLSSFLATFREAAATRPLGCRGHALETVRFLESTVPGWKERTIVDADRIRAGVVRLLGEDEVQLVDGSATGDATGRSRLPWHEDLV